MSDTPVQPQTGDGAPADSNAPSMRVLAQYLKDLSFESPQAPQSLGANAAQPAMEVGVDLNARGLGQNRFEVELSCSATARREGQVVFVCEVNYAGLFEILNVPADRIEPVLLVDAPTLLFPFVREVVARSVQNGGFPPLMLEPLDFLGMYQQQQVRRSQSAVEGQGIEAAEGAPEGDSGDA